MGGDLVPTFRRWGVLLIPLVVGSEEVLGGEIWDEVAVLLSVLEGLLEKFGRERLLPYK
jgi:hypothetical protein